MPLTDLYEDAADTLVEESDDIDDREEAMQELDGIGDDSWLSDARDFFTNNPQTTVINWVAAWIVGGVMSLFAWTSGLAFDIVNTFLLIPQTFADVFETLITTITRTVGSDVIGAFEGAFVSAVQGGGPFGFVLSALFITAFLFGVWIGVQVLSRLFRRVIV